MAWKRTKNIKMGIVYKNYIPHGTKYKTKRLIEITPDLIIGEKRVTISRWNVAIHNMESMASDYTLHKFKTRPKAIKFAKAWMKKHPRG